MIHQLRERPVLLREALGEELREVRLRKGLTLREVAAKALVSLGYLSEVERGRKEASSEMLASICEAHEITLSQLLGSVSQRLDKSARTVRPAAIQARAA
jgi:transcriptional regulator with XRE-family HTH domain